MKELIDPFKKFWQFVLVNFAVGTFCAVFFFGVSIDDFSHFIIGSIWTTSIFMTQWLGHSYLQTKISKRWSWIEKPVQRIILTIIAVVVYSVVAFFIVQVIMHLIVFQEIPDYLLQFNYKAYEVPILISFFISVVAAAYGFFIGLKRSIVQQESLKREMLSFKYEALRNQINPHFMFNSLNVLSDLVYDDQKLAVKFIHQFSDIYRYVLDSREKELVPLQHELDFIEKYIFLLKTRFEDKLEVEIDLPIESDDLIVPLSLQLLIENAVKHNEVSTAHPLAIKLIRDGNQICITNPIQLKTTNQDSKKVGLKNLRQQFAYFTDEPINVLSENKIFSVTIPILKEG